MPAGDAREVAVRAVQAGLQHGPDVAAPLVVSDRQFQGEVGPAVVLHVDRQRDALLVRALDEALDRAPHVLPGPRREGRRLQRDGRAFRRVREARVAGQRVDHLLVHGDVRLDLRVVVDVLAEEIERRQRAASVQALAGHFQGALHRVPGDVRAGEPADQEGGRDARAVASAEF